MRNSKKTTQNDNVIAKEYSEKLNGEITLITKGSDILSCNQGNLIGVRLKGKINHDLIIFSVGCVITATNEKGMYYLKCICNENNEKHEITIKLRQENQEHMVVANFDLNKLM